MNRASTGSHLSAIDIRQAGRHCDMESIARREENSALADNFLRYFAPEVAVSAEAQRDAFALRYQVYCEEFGYEEASEFPDLLESDDFDATSISVLLRHSRSGLVAGCARLVEAGKSPELPMERYCGKSIFAEYQALLDASRADSCEVSRLAVNCDFRRRPKEGATRFGRSDAPAFSLEEARTFPLIAVAALLSAFAVWELKGGTKTFAMMEPFLPRLLKRSGIQVQSAGSEVNYHGRRSAYFATIENAVGGLNPELHMLYSSLRSRLSQQLG